MSVELGPMTPEEFRSFRAANTERFAAEQVRAGKWSLTDADANAQREFDGWLPDGVGTKDMVLLAAREGGGMVGRVWFGFTHPDGNPGTGWVYDLEVEPGHRGKGLGRALLAEAERVAAERGLQALALNVFGGNDVAIGLYDSTGYRVTSQHMRKELS